MNLFKSYKEVIKLRYMWIYFIYLTFFLVNGPFEQIIPLLIKYKGFDEKNYGYFLSVINIINIFLPAGIAYLASKYNVYKISMIAMLISFLGGSLSGLVPMKSIYLFIGIMFIICGRTVLNFSFGNYINYTLPEKDRGKFLAVRDLFLFGSISLGLLIGGKYIKIFNINSFYTLFSIIFLIPCILIFLLFRKTCSLNTKQQIKKIRHKTKMDKRIIKEILHDKRFWSFAFIELGTTIYATSMDFLPLLGTSLGISVSGIMTMFGAITVVNSIFALIIAHFSDKLGRKWVYVFDLAFDILPAAIFIISNNITLFIIGVVLTMIKDIFAPISFAYFFDCFDDEKGILISGLLSSIGNGLSFLIPTLIGVLWSISSKYVFFIAIIGNLLASLVAAVMLPNIKVNTEVKQ